MLSPCLAMLPLFMHSFLEQFDLTTEIFPSLTRSFISPKEPFILYSLSFESSPSRIIFPSCETTNFSPAFWGGNVNDAPANATIRNIMITSAGLRSANDVDLGVTMDTSSVPDTCDIGIKPEAGDKQ